MNLKKFRGGGSINDPDPQILYENLKKVFPDLSFRTRIFGYDYEYVENYFELYINTTDSVEYFIHIDYEGYEANFIKILKQIEEILDDLSLDFDLGYYEIDQDENQISGDINFRG